jgi:hypothetical protein
MSVSSSMTRPSVRAPGTTSCMRFSERTNVDFPHPEGPITAVTWRSAMTRSMPRSTVVFP